MNNSDFSRLLVSNDKALITELTKAPAKKKNNRPDRKGGKGGKKGEGFKGKRGEDSDDDGGPRGKGKGKGKTSVPDVAEKEQYRDRAKERQEGKAEYAHIAAEFENQEEVTLADSKYLGGDMDHTHLVKGLDFSLLNKVRGELNKQKKAEEIQDQRVKAKNKKRTFESIVAKQVWHTVVDTLHPHHATFGKRIENMSKAISLGQRIRGAPSIFLPGRMAFEFDTDMEQGQQDIPRIVYMSKEDAPKVDTSQKVASMLPETVLRVKDAFARAIEARKQRKLNQAAGAVSSSHVVAQKVVSRHKAVDADDIFGGAGSYADTVADALKKAKEKAAREAKKAKVTPERSGYFDDAGAEKYKKAPEGQLDPNDMIVEEKEGDVVGKAEDEDKPRFEAAERFQGPRAGWVFKLGTQGLGYYRGEKEVSTSASALAAPSESRKSLRSSRADRAARAAGENPDEDEDAYGECFPSSMVGGARMDTLEGDSDEEEGQKKKLKKGDEKDTMDSSAYGQKQKGVMMDPKKKRMSEAQEWTKIDTMIKNNKSKSIGEMEASSRPRKNAPVPRELTATPAFF